jgi:hypothetical protein
MISILPDGSIPVDKINRGENGEPSCPIATKDADINAENKEEAILSASFVAWLTMNMKTVAWLTTNMLTVVR